MNEKIYKNMTSSGIAAIVVGVIVAAVGVTCGIISIVFGGRLLNKRGHLIF